VTNVCAVRRATDEIVRAYQRRVMRPGIEVSETVTSLTGRRTVGRHGNGLEIDIVSWI
jgi:hypothetical protein